MVIEIPTECICASNTYETYVWTIILSFLSSQWSDKVQLSDIKDVSELKYLKINRLKKSVEYKLDGL